MDLYSICRTTFHSNNFVYSPIAAADVESMFEMSQRDGYNDFLSWYPPADTNGMAAIIDGPLRASAKSPTRPWVALMC